MAKLPKSIIKKYGISKKAWQVFRGQKANKSKSVHKTTRRTIMAKRKTSRRRGFLTLNTVGKFIKIGALAAPAATAYFQYSSPQAKVSGALAKYTGYDILSGTFDAGRLVQGWAPYFMASLAITGIGKLNGIVRRI